MTFYPRYLNALGRRVAAAFRTTPVFENAAAGRSAFYVFNNQNHSDLMWTLAKDGSECIFRFSGTWCEVSSTKGFLPPFRPCTQMDRLHEGIFCLTQDDLFPHDFDLVAFPLKTGSYIGGHQGAMLMDTYLAAVTSVGQPTFLNMEK